MDNNKDKDFQVKNDAFNDDLREALRRREAKRPQVEVPADFLDSVMQQVGPDRTHAKAKTWRIALASLAIAACTLTAVLLVWPRGDEKQSDVSELIVRKERTHSPKGTNSQSVKSGLIMNRKKQERRYVEGTQRRNHLSQVSSQRRV